MYSKLVFIIDNEPITFELHEIVKVAMDLTDDENNQPNRIPDYHNYPNELSEKIENSLANLTHRYERHFEINKNFKFAVNGQEFKNPLSYMLNLLYNIGMTSFLLSGAWNGYSSILDFLKGQKRPELLPDNFGDSVLLPPAISDVKTSLNWLSLAKDLKDRYKSEPIKAWWIKIAGRFILLKNAPSERQHFYVSDHGFIEDVVKGVKSSLFKFIGDETHYFDSGLAQFSLAVSFWKQFYETSPTEKIAILKNHFIKMVDRFPDYDDDGKMFLLFTLSLPSHMHECTLREGKLSRPFSSFVGSTDLHDDGWLQPIENQELDLPTYRERERTFYHVLERIRYMSEIQAKTFTTLAFKKALNPFFTQIDNIFHPNDAHKYKLFLILTEVAKALGVGCQEYLFRPMHSFGSRDEGESYRGFADAFNLYFQSDDSISERQLATKMREALKGKYLSDEKLYFLPNLIAAWFVSEAARNENSILSGLILLDLIESGIKLIDDDGNNRYSWRHVLIHPKKPDHTMNEVRINDMYGHEIDLAHFDGMHPMAHAGSVQDAKANLGKKQKLSAVRQKEGHLLLHWIAERLKVSNPSLEYYLITTKEKSKSTESELCCLLKADSTSYDLINKLLKAKKKPSRGINKKSYDLKKWKILHETIIPLLKERLSTLDCLLKTSHEPQEEKSKSTTVPDDNSLQHVKGKSLLLAEIQNKIGARSIEGWALQDVDDKGNCFYDAVAHQMHLMNHSFLSTVPEGTLTRDSIRLRIQGSEFKDREWADVEQIIQLARMFNFIIGIVDTRDPASGFVYHYINANNEYDFTNNIKKLPCNKVIVKLAYTGNHYLSVLETAHEARERITHRFLSNYRSSIFTRCHENFVTEHRHEDPTIQEAYDRRFGLVLKR